MNQIRILHVVGAMNRGGVETWLMNVLRNIDRTQFHMDFLVHTQKPGAFDDEIRTLGSDVIPCLDPSRPWAYARQFRVALQRRAPYDVVHSHVHHYSGFVLRLAHWQGVPVRIAHSHSDTSGVDQLAGVVRRQYFTLTKRWLARYATRRLACSDNAGVALFGHGSTHQTHWLTLRCSIDLTPFQEQGNSQEARRQLGIPPQALVIGHVGSFVRVKNHTFLIEVAAELTMRRPDVYFLLIGDGPLRANIEERIRERGLSHAMRSLGSRSDVARLMTNVMDVLLFPSHYEGLPLVLLEAQAAGLPCVVSDIITAEVDVVSRLVSRVGLQSSPAVWADAILATRGHKNPQTQHAALATLLDSPYNILSAVRELQQLYTSLANRHSHAIHHA